MNKHSAEIANYHNGLFTLWALINGQGSQLARTKAKSTNGHTKAEKNKDCVRALKACRSTKSAAGKETHFVATIIQSRKKITCTCSVQINLFWSVLKT